MKGWISHRALLLVAGGVSGQSLRTPTLVMYSVVMMITSRTGKKLHLAVNFHAKFDRYSVRRSLEAPALRHHRGDE